jgi:hypothetical protein
VRVLLRRLRSPAATDDCPGPLRCYDALPEVFPWLDSLPL